MLASNKKNRVLGLQTFLFVLWIVNQNSNLICQQMAAEFFIGDRLHDGENYYKLSTDWATNFISKWCVLRRKVLSFSYRWCHIVIFIHVFHEAKKCVHLPTVCSTFYWVIPPFAYRWHHLFLSVPVCHETQKYDNLYRWCDLLLKCVKKVPSFAYRWRHIFLLIALVWIWI